MFVGFTPGVPDQAEALINPKFGKIFKIVGGGYPSKGTEFMTIKGEERRPRTQSNWVHHIGTGAAGWF